MAVINRKYGYLFLAEPRTGSRSVAIALRQHEGYESIGSHHATWQFLIKKGYLTFGELDQLTVFSVRRHPADIIISDWFHSDKFLCECIKARMLRETFYWHNHFGWYIFYEGGLDLALNLFFQYKDNLGQLLKPPWGGMEVPMVKLPYKGKTKDKKSFKSYYTEAELRFLCQHCSHLGYTI